MATGEGGQPGLRDGALLLHLSAPGDHQCGIGPCFQGCSVAGKLAVAFGDRSSRRFDGGGVVRLCDVYLSTRRDTAAARSFFARALNTTKVAPVEVVTDKAAVYPTRP